jgi:tungstate transport system permease protein
MEWWNYWAESIRQAVTLLSGGDVYVWSTIGMSLRVSGSAIIFSTLLAFPFAALLSYTRFPGQSSLRLMVSTGMGVPSVIVGLVVLMLLTQRGPLGEFLLIWSPEAMILAQAVLIFPLLTGVALSALDAVDRGLIDAAATLGARPWQQIVVMAGQARQGLMTALLSGLGRAISEVGAVIMVGGNIVSSQDVSITRTLTTAIVVETRQGKFETALALGFILFGLVLLINWFVLRLDKTSKSA